MFWTKSWSFIKSSPQSAIPALILINFFYISLVLILFPGMRLKLKLFFTSTKMFYFYFLTYIRYN
jgi:hypothetical protein